MTWTALIENGLDCSLGQGYPVRVCQWKGDKKEIHLLSGLSENFSTSTYFLHSSYITQEARKKCLSSNDLDPHKFGLRTEETYNVDVACIVPKKEGGIESRCLKFNSILNKIKNFHVSSLGNMAPCIYHDLYAGCFREDVSLIINEILKRNIISKCELNKKCWLFKKKIFGADRRNWLPRLKDDSFKEKLPGTMSQNKCFIRYLSLLLHEELKKHSEFTNSEVWNLYLRIKNISELVCSKALSETQLMELSSEIKSYLDIRIALHMTTKKVNKVDANFFQNLGDLSSKMIWPRVKPKHCSLLMYEDTIREIGLLEHCHTLGDECKAVSIQKKLCPLVSV